MNFGSNEEFIKNYKKLKSARKMAELYNCSKTSILNYAKKINYDNSKNKEKKITNIPIKQVIKDYEELLSCKKVGEKYNCSSTAVANYLKSQGYILKNHNNKLDEIKLEDFIKDYQKLKSAKAMGKKYNCSSTAILNYAKKHNYDVYENKEYKLSEEDKKYIINSYNTKTSNQLAKELNVSRGMITQVWYNNNLLGKKTVFTTTTEIDITGQTFGMWYVLYKTDKRNSSGIIYWHCKCDCGIEKDVLGTSLRQGLTLSCGHHNNISKGNEKIKQLLLDNNIPFEIEKKFKTCKDKLPLPFDFYIDNKYLIEFDGIQHFQKDSIFDYEYTHNHDLIKNRWCQENNIPLIRIPYTHLKKLNINDLLLKTSSFIVNNAD